MQEKISPARRVSGAIRLPGDKSISHRYAMLAAIANGSSRIRNYSGGADCQSTLRAMAALGAGVEPKNGEIVIHGRGLEGLSAPAADLDAGNSGSTIRMLSGILAGQKFTSRIFGDESLSRRPMDRIMKPLAEMGAVIAAREGRFPPLQITGAPLRPIEYTLPVPSAQVKSCVLLAGLYAEGETIVNEPIRSRDHTEIALREFGAGIRVEPRRITLRGRPRLEGRDLAVPSDLSSAAFFMVAALLVPDSDLVIQGVGLNPTRSKLLDFLVSIGARIQILDVAEANGELVGDLRISSAPIRGGRIEGEMTAALIDEIPVLAVLGAASDNGLEIRDASELRVKETDRIDTVARNFERMGIHVEARPDGMLVPGRQHFRAAQFDSFGDHRIAMAFAVAALRADGESIIDNADSAAVSFPQFFSMLRECSS
ncbi:MAG TPA: 3-phosphoshikimate 1-carboxyvinyltransferase [Bryobacteraceae bacterium]|nr:3-phosphoshikimate 1-carboxyvinyltransferase [Bryobacteraceae bacterium]